MRWPWSRSRPRTAEPLHGTGRDAIRRAIAALPPGVKVPTSRAGRRGLVNSVAWGVLIVGWIAAAVTWYVGAAEQEYSPGAPGTEPLALAIAIVSGLTAGALFSVARDLRGSTTRLRKIMPLPILLAILVAFGGDTSDRSAFGDRLLSALFVLLVTGLPLLSGYLVMRWLVAFNRSRRIELPPQNIRPLLFPELEAATDGARVVALLREYPLDNDGWDFLAVDQKALERAGYETIAISTENDLRRDAQKMVVLFAKKGVLPRPDA